MEINEEKKFILKFVVVMTLLVISIPFLSLTFGGGIENRNEFDKVIFYWAFGIPIFWLLCGLAYFRDKLPFAKGFAIHRPSDNEALAGIRIFEDWRLFSLLCAFILILLVGYLSLIKGTAIGDLPFATGQVAPIANVALQNEPAVTGENSLIMNFIWILLLPIGMYIGVKTKWSAGQRVVASGLLGTLGYFITYAIHSSISAYAGNEIALSSVSITFAVFIFLSVFFCSILPFWIGHYGLNTILAFKELFGKDSSKIYWVILLIIIAGLFVWIYFSKRKR